MIKNTNNRRGFLKNTVAAGAGVSIPYFFSQAKTLADESKSANDRPTLGLIGSGGMGMGNMNSAKGLFDVVAIADVDRGRRESANAKLSGGKADVYNDYRKVIERDDIDLLHIATPDHWHTKPVIEGMLAGKDIYCEKPLTLTIDEGKLIRKVQKQTGRIVQVGTQQRSTFDKFVKAMALVNEGRLGKIKSVQAAIGGAPTSASIPVAEVPEGLDWDSWLGPVPKVDYRFLKNGRRGNTNGHYEFRWWYEYSGGKLTDWGAHHVDIASWALRLNGQTDGPTAISGDATHPVKYDDKGHAVEADKYNTATAFNFKLDFPGGTEMIIRNDTRNGVLIEGDKGRIFVSRGTLAGAPVDALKDNPLPEDAIKKVYKGLEMEGNERRAHWNTFVRCAKERTEPISDVHSHMEMLNLCHLAGISARLGRGLKWDAKNEQITGDDVANSMLSRPYRSGFEIQM